MNDALLRRIEAALGRPGLADALAALTPTDLTSLLLAVVRARSAKLAPGELLRQAERPLVLPCPVDARLLDEIARAAFACAPAFEAIELSPVAPTGINVLFGGVDQNNTLATVRNVELLGDPTTAAALECARRRRRERRVEVRLASTGRMMRLQPTDVPGFSPHFRLFSLVTAGRAHAGFEAGALAEHARVYLGLFRALDGYRLEAPEVTISHARATAALLAARGVALDEVRKVARAHEPGAAEAWLAGRGVVLPTEVDDARALGLDAALTAQLARAHEQAATLRGEFPEARVRVDLARLEGLGYYAGLCLRITARDQDGVPLPLADGGATDWTARLLSDAKERLFVSGIGVDLLPKRYRR